ncbi:MULTISPECIES: hypothetical protein [Pacificibacter]|uniref:hypothetical protein n=1 Tax=Pacificibacter TaxID=1042323 RepID=UPI001C0971A9|nr:MULTISPECIES: hypothetical protein [Pacificibacter]MBU2936358.1 hypothetical protein [Pacificibacter marinus]MDO6616604.1 hypothetical protein [Pacificibacter sp. 1_MG-2023]
MKIRYAVALSLFLPATSFAQSDEPLDSPMHEAVDFTQLSRSEFIDKHEEALNIGWEPSMQLYARVDPSLAEIVPPFKWTDDYVETYGCLYDHLKEQDALGEANAMFSSMQASIDYIYAHPDFSILTLAEHEPFIDMLQPSDLYLEASMSCGLVALNAQAMKDSGLYDAFTAFMSQ